MQKEKGINKVRVILAFIAVILVPVILFYLLKILNPDSLLFSINEEAIQNYVNGWGIWGPIVFIFIQTFTIIFPPTPNLIPMIAGGILFGPVLGLLYSFTGVMLGVVVNFYLTRIFGRKMLERILNNKEMNFVDGFINKTNWRVITFLPFIPGMYADLGGYSMGLSKIKFKKYFFSIGLGYLMLISLASFLGKFVVQNPTLRIMLILLLVGGMISILFIPIVRLLRRRK